jgi:hypothetical protein
MSRWIILATFALALGGCFNGGNSATHYELGDVSLGQQLIDLKAALDAKAIDREEYHTLRQRIMQIHTLAAGEDDEAAHASGGAEDPEDGDFSWF